MTASNRIEAAILSAQKCIACGVSMNNIKLSLINEGFTTTQVSSILLWTKQFKRKTTSQSNQQAQYSAR